MRKFSFIVPLYNSSRWMRKCIDSLLEQDISKEDYDIILVDDGSPDDSGQIAEEYANRYPNIKVIHQENKGASGARNTGLRAADSKYIWLVDPDDYIEPNCLAMLLAKVEEDNLDILRFGYRLVDENHQEVRKHPSELAFDYSADTLSGEDYIASRLGIHCYIWAYIFRLSIIKDNDIYCYEGDYFDDTPWTPRILLKAKKVSIISATPYNYLQRQDSLVRSHDPKYLSKRLDGEQFLIKELLKQRSEAPTKTCIWYDRMLAHSVLSYITDSSLLGTTEIERCCSFIHNNYCEKIKMRNTFGKMKKKAFLFNISPEVLAYIIRKRH